MSGRIQLPAPSSITLDGTYLRPGAILRPGETAAQIQAKADACAAGGTTLVIPDGTWTLTATVIFRCNVWSLGGATFTGNIARLVQVGDDATFYENLTIVLPKLVRQTQAWAAGAITTDQGLTVHRINQSVVWIPQIKNFAEGMAAIPSAGGAAYNKFFIGHLENNAVNERLDPQTGGWVNDNQFYGGRYSHTSSAGTNVTGTRHILVKNSSAFGAPNNNVWFSGSVEGNVAEFNLDVDAGSENVFKSLRWEATTPQVRWGAGAVGNRIEMGYNAANIAFTQVSGQTNNTIATRHGFKLSSSFGKGVYIGTAGTTTPVFVTLTPAEVLSGDPATEYLWSVFGDGSMRAKAKGDAFERIRIDPATGEIRMGDGTATPVKKITPFSTSIGIQGASLIFISDNTWDIGQSAANRPRDLFLGRNATIGGTLTVNTIQVGGRITATATLDFPSIAAGGSQELAVTVTGAAVNDMVSLAPPATIEAGLVWDGYVSAANTVKVRVSNITSGAIDPASATWKVAALK